MPYPNNVPSSSFRSRNQQTFESFFSLFFFRGNYICMNLRFVLFARLKILPLSFLRLQYLGTVQNGRHKSTSLIIFSHLVKLHAHVQHKTCIDHTPERQWLATTMEPHKCPLHVSLTLFNHLILKESSHINFQLFWPVLDVCSDMLFYCVILGEALLL